MFSLVAVVLPLTLSWIISRHGETIATTVSEKMLPSDATDTEHDEFITSPPNDDGGSRCRTTTVDNVENPTHRVAGEPISSSPSRQPPQAPFGSSSSRTNFSSGSQPNSHSILECDECDGDSANKVDVDDSTTHTKLLSFSSFPLPPPPPLPPKASIRPRFESRLNLNLNVVAASAADDTSPLLPPLPTAPPSAESKSNGGSSPTLSAFVNLASSSSSSSDPDARARVSTPVAMIAGVLAGSIVIIAAILVVCVVSRRKRMERESGKIRRGRRVSSLRNLEGASPIGADALSDEDRAEGRERGSQRRQRSSTRSNYSSDPIQHPHTKYVYPPRRISSTFVDSASTRTSPTKTHSPPRRPSTQVPGSAAADLPLPPIPTLNSHAHPNTYPHTSPPPPPTFPFPSSLAVTLPTSPMSKPEEAGLDLPPAYDDFRPR